MQVLKAWLQTYSTVLPHISHASLEDVLAAANAATTHGSTARARAVTGVMLCEAAKVLQDKVTGVQVLHRVQQLCQDTDYSVRICLAGQLPRLAKALKLASDARMVLSEARSPLQSVTEYGSYGCHVV